MLPVIWCSPGVSPPCGRNGAQCSFQSYVVYKNGHCCQYQVLEIKLFFFFGMALAKNESQLKIVLQFIKWSVSSKVLKESLTKPLRSRKNRSGELESELFHS